MSYCKPNEYKTITNWFNFVTEIGDSFLEAYLPIVEKRKSLNFNSAHRKWQEIRRGRYVEFNLVHDKGTLLVSKPMEELKVCMSLPPHVQWVYNHEPEIGSEEARLIEILKTPKNWINYVSPEKK